MHAIVRLRTTRFYPCLSANYQFFYFSPRHWTTAETLLCLLIFTRTDSRFFFFFFYNELLSFRNSWSRGFHFRLDECREQV